MKLLLRSLGGCGMIIYGAALALNKHTLAMVCAAFFILAAGFEGYIEKQELESNNKKNQCP